MISFPRFTSLTCLLALSCATTNLSISAAEGANGNTGQGQESTPTGDEHQHGKPGDHPAKDHGTANAPGIPSPPKEPAAAGGAGNKPDTGGQGQEPSPTGDEHQHGKPGDHHGKDHTAADAPGTPTSPKEPAADRTGNKPDTRGQGQDPTGDEHQHGKP